MKHLKTCEMKQEAPRADPETHKQYQTRLEHFDTATGVCGSFREVIYTIVFVISASITKWNENVNKLDEKNTSNMFLKHIYKKNMPNNIYLQRDSSEFFT